MRFGGAVRVWHRGRDAGRGGVEDVERGCEAEVGGEVEGWVGWVGGGGGGGVGRVRLV